MRVPALLLAVVLGPCCAASWSGEDPVPVTPPPAGAAASDRASGLTVIADGATIIARDAAGGRRWACPIPNTDRHPVRALSIADGRVLVDCGPRQLATIDLGSGKLIAVRSE